MLGLGMGLWNNVAAQSGGGGGAWAPNSASTPLAVWYDPSDLTTLFKDTGGTTPVTADGDLVARMNDKSGNGNHVLQATSGARLVYRTNSGKPYLESANDSVARYMNTSAAITLTDGSGQHSAAAAAMFYNLAGTCSVFDADQASGTRLSQTLRSGGSLQSIAFNSGGSAFTDTAGTTAINTGYALREITTTSAVETWVNGTSNGSTAVTPPMQSGTAFLTVMGHNLGVDQSGAGRFYGGAGWKGVLSSGDQASADTYFSGKM